MMENVDVDETGKVVGSGRAAEVGYVSPDREQREVGS